MQSSLHYYNMLILESHLDTFGHVNNATYLTILEEARWDLITRNGYGLHQIQSTGVGPVILDIHLQFLKELTLRDEIVIETDIVVSAKKIFIINQRIIRDAEVCCTAKLTAAIFDLNKRKIIPPTPEWLHAMNFDKN